RIGVHTGLANVGNFGSADRFDYTALGENINLASRLEGLNKHLGTDILITRQTAEGASDKIVTRLAGHFRLKGFEKVVEVLELFGGRVSEPQSLWGQPEAGCLHPSPTPLCQVVHLRKPFPAQVETGGLPELFERPAGVHPQAKRGRFPRARQRRQLLGPFDCAPAFLDLLAIENRVRPVFRSHAAQVAGGAWT